MSKSCFFTGHRILKITDTLYERLRETLVGFIENGATDFYAGGAIGWDMLCENTVLQLKTCYPHIKLHLILPCPPEEQTSRWRVPQKDEYYRILKAADSVETLSAAYHKDCMKIRNSRLADLGDICICYYNEQHRYGGTYQTVNMAQKHGKSIFNLFD